MVLVDNATYSFQSNVDNGIPIINFFDNKQDTELRELLGYLKSLYDVPDVRTVNRNYFKFHKSMNASSAFSGLLSLFDL